MKENTEKGPNPGIDPCPLSSQSGTLLTFAYDLSICLSDQFKKIVKRYIRVGYNLGIMRQSACLELNPIMVCDYDFLFNCTTVGQASDSMTALT